MLKSGRYCQPGCNQRYADFWSQGRNQWIASILIAGIAIVAIVGIAYLIMNGISYKTTYTGYAILILTSFNAAFAEIQITPFVGKPI